jgi:hypothetical protein
MRCRLLKDATRRITEARHVSRMRVLNKVFLSHPHSAARWVPRMRLGRLLFHALREDFPCVIFRHKPTNIKEPSLAQRTTSVALSILFRATYPCLLRRSVNSIQRHRRLQNSYDATFRFQRHLTMRCSERRLGRRGCNRRAPLPPSLSLGSLDVLVNFTLQLSPVDEP